MRFSKVAYAVFKSRICGFQKSHMRFLKSAYAPIPIPIPIPIPSPIPFPLKKKEKRKKKKKVTAPPPAPPKGGESATRIFFLKKNSHSPI